MLLCCTTYFIDAVRLMVVWDLRNFATRSGKSNRVFVRMSQATGFILHRQQETDGVDDVILIGENISSV